MPRLIDADALLEDLDLYAACGVSGETMPSDRVRAVIKRADTVDAVAVVRCRECQHWDFEDCECGSVYGLPSPCEADDFCSYGERKEPADGRTD